MPRQSATVVNNRLIKGLITEATGMAFPPEACTETFDCVFDKTGKITRRPGFALETNLSVLPTDVTRDTSAVSEFVWETVGGDGDLTLVVVQYGNTLRFFKLSVSGGLSDKEQTFSVNLNNYLPAGSAKSPKDKPCQYTYGKGHLFVTHPYTNPIFIEYDAAGPSINVTEIDIEIRDFEGVDDNLAIDERPTVITDAHRYNLYNQGWGALVSDPVPNMVIAYEEWDANLADFPSNADIWWVMKDTNNNFDTAQRNDMGLHSTPAPKGHYVLNAFEQDREAALEADTGGAHTIAIVSSDDLRPSACTFFAGRVWYSGVTHKDFADKIYFSQIIERDEQIGFCYQLNDPTAEHQSDLLPSDGGVISIPDAGLIYKLIPVQEAVLVFASNGVWAIQGSEGLGFRANDYSITKVSGIQTRSATSFVMVEGLPIYWTLSGIYTVGVGEQGSMSIQSLTDTTIQSFFNEIPVSAILKAKGAYNPITKVVQWVYRRNHATGDNAYDYNRVLNFNVQTGAFYPWTIGGNTSIKINGLVCLENVLSETASLAKFYYLTTDLDAGTSYNFLFALCDDTDYIDWDGDADEQTYESYFVTAYSLLGEGNKDFQNNYITVYIENDSELHSLFVQGVWDYSLLETTKRWSNEQQCYNFADMDDFGVVFRKLKIRGRGKVLQLRFSSDAQNPFTFIGYSAFVSGNANV